MTSFKVHNGNNSLDLHKVSLKKLFQMKYSRNKTGRNKNKCQKDLMKENPLPWAYFLSNCNKFSNCIQQKSVLM